MLRGKNIVCFAKDWDEDPTSNNHVMKLLARDNKVLWLNSIATRTPQVTSARDMGKIANKLKSFAKGVKQVEENLWVYTPIVLPFPYSNVAKRLNRQILRGAIAMLRRQLNMKDFQVWTFLPTAAEYCGRLGESLVVYYCTDEFSQFTEMDTEKIVAMERDLCQRADIVFTTAHSLLEAKKPYNPETHLASHGVEHAHFVRALDDSVAIPADVRDLPRPILGFFGLIHDWIDQDLIAYVAAQRPDWSIVLIGNARVDVSRLEDMANVHLLGRKPYDQLPGYCKAFSVGLVPFAVNDLTKHVNPIKLREYLSAGLPVVSTPMQEVTYYSDICAVAESREAFLAACDDAVKQDTPEHRERRSNSMLHETWEQKIRQLGEHVMRVERGR